MSGFETAVLVLLGLTLIVLLLIYERIRKQHRRQNKMQVIMFEEHWRLIEGIEILFGDPQTKKVRVNRGGVGYPWSKEERGILRAGFYLGRKRHTSRQIKREMRNHWPL